MAKVKKTKAEKYGAVFYERKRWLFFGLPFTFTKYIIKEDVVTRDIGFFRRVEDDCYMYKIQDVRLQSSLLQRIVKIGTIICYTGDTTDKQLILKNVKNSRALKDYILQTSEEARRKRRTLNTLNIGASDLDEVDPADVD